MPIPDYLKEYLIYDRDIPRALAKVKVGPVASAMFYYIGPDESSEQQLDVVMKREHTMDRKLGPVIGFDVKVGQPEELYRHRFYECNAADFVSVEQLVEGVGQHRQRGIEDQAVVDHLLKPADLDVIAQVA